MPGPNQSAYEQRLAAAQAEVAAAQAAIQSAVLPAARDVAVFRFNKAKRALEAIEAGRAEAIAADESAANQRSQQSVIASLRKVAEGGGSAYNATMRETATGNSRIRALASSGRGGLNANLNAQNAVGISTAAGTQQAVANREAEKTQARAALGQAIAQGQDYQASEGQAVLDALSKTPDASNPAENLRPIGQLGEAIWTATQDGADKPSNQQQNNANHKRWS